MEYCSDQTQETTDINTGHEATNNSSTIPQQKPPKGGWNAAIFIIFVEMAERFAFYGLNGNLIMYLTNELREPTPTAAKNVNTWVGVTSLLPLFGAFVADSFLGRFKTILFASIIYCTGMSMLSLSVSVIPRQYRKAVFFVSLYTISIGEGGHKPCVLTFAADQFGEDSLEEKKTKSSFYNWWSLGIVTGATFAIFAVIYVQDNVGWGTGFGMLAGAMAVALGVFVLGIRRYRTQFPLGSPFTAVAQVFVAAARKWKLNEARDGNNWGLYYGNAQFEGQPNKLRTLARTHQFRFLDKATIINDVEASTKVKNPWRLCSVNQVEEVKLVLRLIPIWLTCLMFPVVQTLLNTYFTKQGSTLIRTVGSSFEIPPASFQGFVTFTVLITIPIYDRVFIPIARRFTGHPSGITVLQRVGTGIFLSIINMIVSGLVEAKRLSVVKEYNLMDNPKATVPMRIWWLLPQYILCGLSDAFTFIGLQELFYDQMPDAMRSVGAAANMSITGVGNFVSNAIISAVQGISSRHGGAEWLGDNINRAHLHYFYWLLAGLSALNLCAYVWAANCFVYKKVEVEEASGEHLSLTA
ncbi:protein NRT1/ PTR FAMILY 5.4 [Morus notabilis]|nr:protein NRT1/ PTR FAMILY 5.4 [Morus notabilis]